ncbi:DUF397 domain-containing protein [Streptomyces cinerochromogenes]|uniref:DUF397 domain-containing protein n=1 Tax=Streptomyces cinerochromogenes TaxID=66422 RepID=UPI00199B6028|nr:DUF397 domain-containing protein [Streptomyces cinerochromogenes]GGS82872.1 hypothetical protein GCM10010206_51810 [Streptomyces cinerochromogenes]
MTEPNWRTSSYTKSDSCVEVADSNPQRVMIRDTKDRGRGVLGVRPATWTHFVTFTKDLPPN